MNEHKKILIVTTNYSGDDNSPIKETGVYLEEFAVPYLVFKDTGYEITVASPKGGLSPVDEKSMSCSNPMEWDECIKILRNTTRLSEVNYKEYDAIFLPGGHGPMFDLANDEFLKEIVEYFYEVLCYYLVGFVIIKCLNTRKRFLCAVDLLIIDKKVTSFTNKEEYITKMNESVPFLLETKIRQLGARFEDAEPWSEHVCVDKNIITGQNPQSSLLLSEKMVEALS